MSDGISKDKASVKSHLEKALLKLDWGFQKEPKHVSCPAAIGEDKKKNYGARLPVKLLLNLLRWRD